MFSYAKSTKYFVQIQTYDTPPVPAKAKDLDSWDTTDAKFGVLGRRA
jgi:hypothetical protein